MTLNQKERYEGFLNEAYTLAKIGELTGMKYLTEKYGISSSFMTFLRDTKVFLTDSESRRYPRWSIERPQPFSSEEVGMLINDFRNWKERRKAITKLKEDAIAPPEVILNASGNGNGITKYSTSILIAELHRRGYSGTLYIKKEISV
jgi:hypothetical protein